MWTVITSGIVTLVKEWFITKQKKEEAKQAYLMYQARGETEWDNQAMEASKYSWKDELITLIWFSPLVVAWFYPERALQWITFVGALPVFYQIIMFGIVSASFGLRWYFKQTNLSNIIKGSKP